MADPLTHSFLGMAITPRYPLLGASFALLPDIAQLLTAIRLNTTTIWKEYNRWPKKLKILNAQLHRLWWPLFALFFVWLILPLFNWAHRWDPSLMTQFVLCYLSHNLIDLFTHDVTAGLQPFVKGWQSFGRTYHDLARYKQFWWRVLIMVVGSFALSWFRGAWQFI